MKLFLVESATLRELGGRADGPERGDVVAYWRDAQDAEGTAARRCEQVGIAVLAAESLVDGETSARIDAFVDRFGRHWHRAGDADDTVVDGFSFADALTKELHTRTKINLLVRYGCIYARLFARFPHVREVVTDFIEGANWQTGNRPNAHGFPRLALLRDMAGACGIGVGALAARSPIPPTGFHGDDAVYRSLARSLVGGLRPRYLAARLGLRFRGRRRPRIYVFEAGGTYTVAAALGRRPDVDAVSDIGRHAGVVPLRYDHLLALPSVPAVRALSALGRIVRQVRRLGFAGEMARFEGIDFGPYFARALGHLFRTQMPAVAIRVAQVGRMLDRLGPAVVVVNGEGSTPARVVEALGPRLGFAVAYIDHTHTLVPFGYHPYGRNQPHVVYVAQGEDHVRSYGRDLPAEGKPRRPVLTNPSTSEMDGVRGRRSKPEKRVLLTNFSAAWTYTVARFAKADRYLIDLFLAARLLGGDGFRFTYRAHPGYRNPAYVDFLLRELGLEGRIAADQSPTFADALLAHDLVVANVSGCLYQALHAGWPTVFYEPDFDPRHFVGLPAAVDLERPIATTPAELARMIREGIEDPASLTARFPALFNTAYAPRFVGRDADRAAEVLAEFLARDLAGAGTEAAAVAGRERAAA